MDRLQIRASSAGATRNRLMSSLLKHVPGAWVSPSPTELIALYRQRFRMALADQKYDTALIFLNKILELEPLDLEAKFCKGQIYHRHLSDYPRAIEQYQKVIRLTAGGGDTEISTLARSSMSEIMELLS